MEDNAYLPYLISLGAGGLLLLWALWIARSGEAPLYHGDVARRDDQPILYWIVFISIALAGALNVGFGVWMIVTK